MGIRKEKLASVPSSRKKIAHRPEPLIAEDMTKAAQVSAKRIPARSAAQLAEQSCEEMIQNLKRNVGERAARSIL
jgi:hypothetical protein